ncbi:hypothetical protein D3C84_1029810 [compost metagenome]
MLLSGCGALFERTDHSRPTMEYYQGIKYDWDLLTLKGRGGYDPMPTLCYLSLGCPLLTLVSIPVDFVVDTTALPFDYQTIQKNNREIQAYRQKKYCYGSNGPDEKGLSELGYDKSLCQSARSP